MTLVLSPKEARALWAVLNYSRVKLDDGDVSVEDKALERLSELGKPMTSEDMSGIMETIWSTLNRRVSE
jgi:hypothetical protein